MHRQVTHERVGVAASQPVSARPGSAASGIDLGQRLTGSWQSSGERRARPSSTAAPLPDRERRLGGRCREDIAHACNERSAVDRQPALVGRRRVDRGDARDPAGLPAEESGVDRDQLAREANDPTASLMAFNLLGAYISSFHGPDVPDDRRTTLTFRLVVPYAAFFIPNILRLTMPCQVAGRGEEELKDDDGFEQFSLNATVTLLLPSP
jgi:hypothetical protein